MSPFAQSGGFTLIELIVAITISAIIVLFMGMFMTYPIQQYFSQTARASLVDYANATRRMMDSDVRTSLPTSLRTGGSGSIVMLEFLATADNAVYYPVEAAKQPYDLVFSPSAATQFDTIGSFTNTSNVQYVAVAGAPLANPYDLTSGVINSVQPSNIYPARLPPAINVSFTAFTFAAASPSQHVFLVTGPVAYLCDTNAQTLTRYWGYGMATSTSAHDSAAKMLADGASSSLIANNVTQCVFSATAGATAYGQLAILQIVLTNSSGSMTIMDEVSESNPA